MSDAIVESSPEQQTPVIEVPKGGPEYDTWRKTGKVTEPKPARADSPKEDSTTSKKSSGAEDQSAESSTVSETESNKQEQRKRGTAETRLNEILGDLKKAGLSPQQLKNWKAEAQQAAAEGTEAPKPPKKTAQPDATEPKAPVKPKVEDFESYEAFEAAKDKYFEELADHRAELKFHQREQAAKAAEQQREVNAMLQKAKDRYGEAAEASISEAAKTVFNDAKIPSAIKAIVNDSAVMVDLLYTLGAKGDELADFVKLAKEQPGQALRKLVLMEQLVAEELGRGAAKSDDAGDPVRDASGKFVAATPPPAKKVTQAPPPPREASGRSGAPADEVESAAKSGDFASYRAAQNRRDLARHSGR